MSASSNMIIFALAVAAIAAAAYMITSKEGFWNLPSRTWKVEKVLGGPDFYQTPGYQSMLSPRFSNVDYGPNMRTQLPDYDMSAVPVDPLGGDLGPMDTYNPTGYKQILSATVDPEQSSVGAFLNADGEFKQPIIYDRYLYANRHSRLRAQGDYFRGDLPIVPNTGNWFVPSVKPNIDLNAGAINVMAGVNNETNHQLASLIYNSSGGGNTCIGGVDLEPIGQPSAFSRMNMVNRNTEATMSAGGDVIVTAFP